MTSDLKRAVVRIFNPSDEVVGAGFLASERYVITCAHVVAQALGVSDKESQSPGGDVRLDFPLVESKPRFYATVVCWCPVDTERRSGDEDIAVLELSLSVANVGEIEPVGLITTDDFWKHSFKAFGFPPSHDGGVWASGELLDIQLNGWIQIEAIKQLGYFVSQGFSGTAVWDETLGGVAGMIVGADRRVDIGAAFAIPTNVILRACPMLRTADLTERGASRDSSRGSKEEESEPSFQNALIKLGKPSFVFTRGWLVDKALELVRNGKLNIVLFQGLPGSGKAVLLSQVTEALRYEYSHALVVKFAGPAALEQAYFLEALNEFLLALGRGIERSRLSEQTFEQTLNRLIVKFGDLRALILLAEVDVVPPSWLDLFLRGFAFQPQIRIIGTTSARPHTEVQAHVIDVLPLTENESSAFAEEYARVFGLDIDVDLLMERLPRAVRSNPQALVALLAQLRDVPLDLLLLQGTPADGDSPVQVVAQILTLLREPEQEALALTEVLEEVDISNAVHVLELALPGDFAASIRTLVSKSLINRLGRGYSVPAVVTEAFRMTGMVFRKEAALRIAQALPIAIPRYADSDPDLKTLVTISVRAALFLKEQAQLNLLRSLINEEYLELLTMRGLWKEYLILLRLGIAAAGQLNDDTQRFRLSCRLARKLLQMGETTEARTLLVEIQQFSAAVEDSLDGADVRSHRALLDVLDGKLEPALQELAKSHTIRKSLGDYRGMAIMENIQGNIHLSRKEFDKARIAYEAALIHFGDQRSRYVVDVEMNLGLCTRAQGLSSDALAHLKRATDLCLEFGYNALLPRVLYHLATVMEDLGHLEDALRIGNEAAQKLEDIDQRLAVIARMLTQRLVLLSKYSQ